MVRLPVLIVASLLAAGSPAHAKDGEAKPSAVPAALSPAVQPAAAVVDSFHAALARGDTGAALDCLSDDVLIYESGGVERSKAEYAAHHLGADAEFAKAVPGSVTRRTGGANGALAWVSSEGRTSGNYKGRDIDRVTSETMLLRQTSSGWKIVHIHWSSAAAPGSK